MGSIVRFAQTYPSNGLQGGDDVGVHRCEPVMGYELFDLTDCRLKQSGEYPGR